MNKTLSAKAKSDTTTTKPFYRLWLAALALFVLAGSTGALLRFGVFAGFPWGLQFANVRHAHSHLMYFGWVTPALMALIAARLPELTQRPLSPTFRPVISVTLAAGLLSYVPFLLYGYRSADIFGLTLPFSVIAAALNVLCWYAFAVVYWRETRGVPRHFPLQLWDAALLFLALASLGAWGLPLLTLLGVQDPTWAMAMTHLFLDTFADGWFVLAVLGLLYAAHPAAARESLAHRSHGWMVIGLPVLFLLGVPTHLLPLPVRLIGGAGGLLVGAALLGHLRVLWPHAPGWRVPLAFLGLKAVTQLAIVVPPVARWAEGAGLRVPYLHWLLLGFVSLGLVTAAQQLWGETAVPGRRWFIVAALLLLATILPLTQLWPAFLRGRWVLQAAAWGAVAPVVVALIMLVVSGWHVASSEWRVTKTVYR